VSEHATRLSILDALLGGFHKLRNAAKKAQVLEAPIHLAGFFEAVTRTPELVEVLRDPLVAKVVRDGAVLRQLALLLRAAAHSLPEHLRATLDAAAKCPELTAALAHPAVARMLRDPKNLRELAQLLLVAASSADLDSPAVN
jgi:hypothetical protein